MAANTLDLGNLLIRLNGDNSNFMGMMNQSEKRLMSYGRKMQQAGLAMSLRVTAPLVGMGVAATKSFASFDQAMIKSLSIMKGLSPELKKALEFEAIELSKESITSSKDLAESYYSLASAGLDAKSSLAALDVVNNFAIAGHMNLIIATRLSIDAQKTLGLAYDDSEKNALSLRRVTDTLTFANTLANATVQEYAFALGRYGAAAMRAYNIELEEGIAMLAAYAKMSIKGEHAGNMFSRMLRLTTAGFKDHRQVWRSFGIDLYNMDRSLKPLWTIVNDISGALEHLSTESKIAALKMMGFQARSQQAIFPLLGLGNAIEENYKKLKNMTDYTEKVAILVQSSFSNSLKIVWNNVKEVSRQIGVVLAPYVLKLAYHIQRLSDWFFELSDKQKKWIVVIALAAAALGPMLFITGKLLTNIAMMAIAFRILGIAMSAGLVASVGKIVLMFGAFVAVSVLIISAWRDVKKVFMGEGDGGIGTYLYDQFSIVQKGALWMAAGVVQAWGWIKTAGVTAWLHIKKKWVELHDFIFKGIGKLTGKFADMVKGLETAMNKLPELLKPDEGFDFGSSTLEALSKAIATDGKKSVEAIEKEIKEAWEVYETNIETNAVALVVALDEVEARAKEAAAGVKNSMGDMVKDYVAAQLDKFTKTVGEADLVALTSEQRGIKDKLALMDTEIQYLGVIKEFKDQAIEQEQFAAELRDAYSNDLERQVELLEEFKEKQTALIEGGRDQNIFMEKIGQYARDTTNLWSEMGDVAVSSIQSIGDNITQMLMGGQADWKAFATSVLAQLLRIMVQALLVQAVMAMFGMTAMPMVIGGGTSTVQGSTMQSGFADGGAFVNGVQAFAKGSVINSPTFFPMKNQAGVMGEAGPEAIMPLGRMSNGELGIKSESQQPSFNIVNVFDKSEMLAALSGAEGEAVIMNVLKRNKRMVQGVMA